MCQWGSGCPRLRALRYCALEAIAGIHCRDGLKGFWLLSLGGAILQGVQVEPPQEEGRWERVELDCPGVWDTRSDPGWSTSPTRFWTAQSGAGSVPECSK